MHRGHVWKNYCLRFESVKLSNDQDLLSNYGVKNGDEVRNLFLAIQQQKIIAFFGQVFFDFVVLSENNPGGKRHRKAKKRKGFSKAVSQITSKWLQDGEV